MSLLEELKRRNVFRVGIAYVVVAWLVLQVADIVLNNVEAPSWAFWLILLLLGIGLVLVVVFSWVFEMTPEGIRREEEIDRSQSITAQTGKRLDRLIIGVLVLALAYFVIDKFVLSGAREADRVKAALQQAADAPAEPAVGRKDAGGEKSIAVLPFVNMSEDAGNEYFSDGISEEILNALAKVKKLKVAGRTSSFAFKGRNEDLREIGEALGVQHILEGSVRKAGNQVRITAQLIKVDDGFHLWSENYDRELNDVFAIQDEIANAILLELKAALLEDNSPLIGATRTEAEAYELYLLAKQRMYERTELTLKSAAQLLDEAIAIDPRYAPAYAQRAIAALLLSQTSYGTIPHEQASAQAKLYLDKALELDPDLAEAWAGLGLYHNGTPPRPYQGIEALEKALTLNPNLIDAGNWLVLAYWSVNRATDAMTLLDELTERDPLYKPAFGNRVFALSAMGRTEEARGYIDNIEPFMPDDAQILQTRGWVDYAEGKKAAGLKRFQAALEKQPTDRVFRVGVNEGYYATHQYERVFDDYFSGLYTTALFNLGRIEEARIEARERAAKGSVKELFRLLNATGQSAQLISYVEDRWRDLDAFQLDVPAGMWGFSEMADIALAYRRAGNQARFDDAMARLRAAITGSLSQGVTSNWLIMSAAAYHALAGEREQALARLAQAIDGGEITSIPISREHPFFEAYEGDPEFEAIEARMIDHLNRERELLGLEPLTT